MIYNMPCRDEQNTGRFVFQSPSIHNLVMGKAPFMCRTFVPAVHLDNDGAREGRFVMLGEKWQKKVYHRKRIDYDFSAEEWLKIREVVIGRDGCICQRCDKKLAKKRLTVHHMIPRCEGGTNRLDNLITLCNDCHDFVEIHDELRTRAAIMGSYEDPLKVDVVPLADDTQEDPYNRPEWHKYVYGGKRR